MSNDELRPNESDMHDEIARVVQFLRRATRFWAAPAIALGLGLVACAAFWFLKKPTYKSETVILYSEGIRQSENGDDSRSGSRTVSTRLKEILTSRAELANIVSEFKLYPKTVKANGVVDAVDELRRHVEFKAPGGDTFSIAFDGATPEEAKLVTTRLAETVIEQDATLRKKQAVITRDFLELEKMGTESQLKDAEQALASFMAAHPRFALDATPLATGAAIRATMGGGTQATVVTPNMPFMPRTRASSPGVAASPAHVMAAAPPANREAAEEQVKAAAALEAAQARLTDLSARFMPQYPDVKNAAAEVERAKARVAAAAVAAGASRVETKPAAAAPQGGGEVAAAATTPAPVVRAVRAALAPAGTPPRNAEDEKNVVALETDWVKLTRAVTEARQHQDQVESALFKAGIQANSEVGGHGVQVSVIDPAFLPERPVPPGRSTIMLLIMAAALVLGVVGSLVGAALDDRIHDGRELETVAPVLVSVPRQLFGRANG
jgi:capsular polysaccharide biosynthesis protein